MPGWFARASDAESAALAGDPVPASIDAGAAWLQRHRERLRDRSAIRWAIVAAGSAGSVGTIGLTLAGRSGELGLVIARAHWNRGIATAAARLVLAYAARLGLAEIQAEILDRNHASRRLFEKLGFHPLRAVADADPYQLYALNLTPKSE